MLTKDEKVAYLSNLIERNARDVLRNPIYDNFLRFRGRFAVLIGGSGCVDKDTEFFNGTGWKKINEYDNDLVLQYEEDGKARLVEPSEHHKIPCDELTHFRTHYGVDQCLSDEHRVVYENKTGKLMEIPFHELKERHKNLKSGFSGRFRTTFDYEGEGIDLTEYELRLMVAVIADGSFQCSSTRCRFNLKKDRKKERLKWLFEKCKIEYAEKESTNKGFVFFYANVPMHLKNFPDEWYSCNKEQLKIIAEECMYWDGSGGNSFSTTIKKDADFIQFVYSSIGERATISINNRVGQDYVTNGKTYIRKSIEYTVVVSKNNLVSIKNRHNKTEMKPYKTKDGYKYCFTVPSSMLILRRHNRVFVTKNSGKSYAAADKIIDRIIQEDNHRILCVRAERKQVSDSQFPLLKSRIVKRYPKLYQQGKFKINEAKGLESITFLDNDNNILFAGLDDVEKLKSIYDISSIWVNKMAQLKPL